MGMELMAVKIPADRLKALKRKAEKEGYTYPGCVRKLVDDYLAKPSIDFNGEPENEKSQPR